MKPEITCLSSQKNLTLKQKALVSLNSPQTKFLLKAVQLKL